MYDFFDHKHSEYRSASTYEGYEGNTDYALTIDSSPFRENLRSKSDSFYVMCVRSGPWKPLIVSAAADVQKGIAPLTVSFTSTVEPGIPPYHFLWDFGAAGLQ